MKNIFWSILLLFLLNTYIESSEGNQKFIEGFSQYKPTYLLFGDNKDQVKAHLSFKYQLFQPYNLGLYLGYSQTMFWDVYDNRNSSPMRDVNYNPEIFWIKEFSWFAGESFVQAIPFEHKSNGRPASPEDRTWDRSGAAIGNTFNLTYVKLFVSAKVYTIYNVGSNNKDIAQYMGNGEYVVGIKPSFKKDTYFDKEEISVGFIVGQNGKGARVYNVKFRTLLPYFAPYFYLQICDGYGESLLGYNVDDTSYRFGLIFE